LLDVASRTAIRASDRAFGAIRTNRCRFVAVTEVDENLDMNDDDIARVCHEAIRAMQVIGNEAWISPPWDDAAQWQREAALGGVRAAKVHVDATPEQAHEAWCSFKRSDGWTYGPEKDPQRKTHPCLVEFRELSTHQRLKDSVFLAIVASLSGATPRR
jgi:hypothetical protein